MINDFKFKFFAGLVLYLFDFRPLHFHDPAALQAYQMIVMRTLRVYFKSRTPVGGGDALDKTAFFQHLKRPEDRDFPNSPTTQGCIDLLLAQVAIGSQQMVQNGGTLRRQMLVMLAQVLLKDLAHALGIAFAACRPSWKIHQFFCVAH